MLRQKPNSPDGRAPESADTSGTSLDIQRELNRLEEMLLDSPRVPLSRRTMVDEESFLDQLDVIRLSLPDAFEQAESILRQKEEILAQAEQYAQEIIATAEQQASQILNETGILRQAEYEAQQIRQQVQQECELAHSQVMAEVEQSRRQALRDLEEARRGAAEEAEDIQKGADEYADKVLRDMEANMGEMLRIVRNGRQQLRINQPENRNASTRSAIRQPSPTIVPQPAEVRNGATPRTPARQPARR
jgi:F0F1-type ATP synthase membrane subunit b/b'